MAVLMTPSAMSDESGPNAASAPPATIAGSAGSTSAASAARSGKSVEVVPYDAGWPVAFEAEARRVLGVLGACVRGLHHVGSTSVPGLAAKPIIDMLLAVTDLSALDAASAGLVNAGYESLGEFGLPARRYFRLHDAQGRRSHHLHAYAEGDPEAWRHLAFRDYLRAHPDVSEAYATLKRRLADAHPADMGAYMDGKHPFIQDHQARALRWAAQP